MKYLEVRIAVKYILKRLLFYIIAFFGALALNFFLPRMMPGNPVQMFLSNLYKSGGVVDNSTIAAVEKLFGYDTHTPIIISFFHYIVSIFKGDWGVSFTFFSTDGTRSYETWSGMDCIPSGISIDSRIYY